jgi:RimJ/RimL family protein N-acetyltransferase
MKNKQPLAAAPVIETSRLRLRAFEATDLPAFCELWNDPAVYRNITGQPLSEEDHWGRLLKLVGHWHFVGFGSWAITDKMSGKLIGQCGFNDYRREITPPMPEPELGWVLQGNCHGKGFGFEATSASLAWFDQQIEVKQTACIVDPANTPSLKLATKLGYTLTAKSNYKGKLVSLLHRQHPGAS